MFWYFHLADFVCEFNNVNLPSWQALAPFNSQNLNLLDNFKKVQQAEVLVILHASIFITQPAESNVSNDKKLKRYQI